MNYSKIPEFGELPLKESDPPLSAWGLWKNPALGSLNHLHEIKTLEAAKSEIKTGDRVTLNLPLDAIDPGLLGRQIFQQKVIDKSPSIVNDDIITFNTQGSSQWDGFRHFAYQKEGYFYNGVTQQDIHGKDQPDMNSISAWAKHAIAGRAFLIDYFDWALETGKSYDPLASSPISLSDVQKIIQEKEIRPQEGDILIIRTGKSYGDDYIGVIGLTSSSGYIAAYQQADAATRGSLSSKFEFPGLAQSQETCEWLWKCQYAAVAADSPAFECTPPLDFKWALHPILLAGWGTPIGELFDLESLAKTCKRLKRWTFFFVSIPLNYTGAVASPPNAMAIF
ncbi:hypothetical protein N7448_004444 [Penicillium atrosanguineum]|uniref:uncharacterized protein n=1 Tax=Penicillium atrosanguineum TaxID=1132637 RepID=UPI0023A17C0F|nr:uncharacterized protein N7443_008199 [Penicillium atrosanguineum]KAJ5125118.1 hypothetical protein N7526_007295 [Penicillium atrosanguineum]KAJ5135890.1 hypothetical protein N7448_004444 [Penicillium atrosanguineum]KAJ5292246.1 hypothetical protein N7443_008199 [Penicillium atrosanguineum]